MSIEQGNILALLQSPSKHIVKMKWGDSFLLDLQDDMLHWMLRFFQL